MIRKLLPFSLIFTLIILSACSNSNSQGIDKSLFSDGNKIALAISKDLDENDTLQMPQEVRGKIDKFLSKYGDEDYSGKESDFLSEVSILFSSYMLYKKNNDLEELDNVYNQIKILKKEYGADL